MTAKNGAVVGYWLDKLWPVLVAIVMIAFFVGGRMESPTSKQARIDTTVRPVKERVVRLEDGLTSHSDLPGHQGMAARMDNVETAVGHNRELLEEILQRMP